MYSSDDEHLASGAFAGIYLPERLNVEDEFTPLPSPGEPELVLVEMGTEGGEEEVLTVLKDLKQTRTTAKSRYTTLRKAILGLLENPDVPESRVAASEKEFQNAFEKLLDTHSQFVGAKYLDEDDQEPFDLAYMDSPVTERLEVETEWTKWHHACERVLQEAHHVDREEAQRSRREEARVEEDRRRTNEKVDAAEKAAGEITRNKEALSSRFATGVRALATLIKISVN